jgi:hypothetical protein
MTTITKTLIPNKEWIVETDRGKIGSIAKEKKGFYFLRKGQRFEFKSLKEIKDELGVKELTKGAITLDNKVDPNVIYGFQCSATPYEPLYNLKKKLPLFAKSSKSKSQYCAGYYVIKFRKGWVKSFCPKLITLERYPYYGPFKDESEMKSVLNNISKP